MVSFQAVIMSCANSEENCKINTNIDLHFDGLKNSFLGENKNIKLYYDLAQRAEI